MRYKFILSILTSFMLFSCYCYRDSKRYCNCGIGQYDFNSDSILLDSIKLFYMNTHSMPESELNSDSELINYAISVKHVKTTTDVEKLKKIDSIIRKIDIIRNVIFNKNLYCSKSRKSTNMRITDVYILYYNLNGVRKKIYLSYYKNLATLQGNHYFFLNSLPINRYKCPLLINTLLNLFH